jgi:hypothetical protein
MLVSGTSDAVLALANQMAPCAGDCNGDAVVTIDEITKSVNIALGVDALSSCTQADIDGDGKVTVNELIAEVNTALRGCPATPTPTEPPTETPTATPTPGDTPIPPPRVVFTGECFQPGQTSRLEPCAPGTVVAAVACVDRASCLATMPAPIGKGVVDAQGQFVVVTPRAQAVAPLILMASLPGIDYRLILDFGLVGPGAGADSPLSPRGTTVPPDVVISGTLIDPISEAGTRILDKVGLESVADEGIQRTVDSVRRANVLTNFALQTPSDAADGATNAALGNRGVESAICSSSLPQAPGSQALGDGGAAFAALVAGPTLPAVVTVGDTSVPASLTLTNASTFPEDGGTLTITQIRLTPACGTDAGFDCPFGFEDPGVFMIKGPAQGLPGTACDGMTFVVSAPDPRTGQVDMKSQFPVVLQQPVSGPLSSCTVGFLMDVLGLPTHQPDSGLPQRNSLVSVFACGTTAVLDESVPAIGESTIRITEPTPALLQAVR